VLSGSRLAAYPPFGGIGGKLQPPICGLGITSIEGQLSPMLEGRIRENMRALREGAGYSRAQLAALCSPKTNYQQIEKLERGERRLTIEWVERIATALRVDVELLVTGKPEFSLAEPVANEVAAAIETVATGNPPEPQTTEQIALLLQALIETFVRHPEARGDLGAARPVVDFLARQFARSAS
jgi:transcriptional regulator with XRE-family HTH domain